MSNKTRLQTNNTNIQALIDKANALPDAGGSGGGATIETYTGTLSKSGMMPPDSLYGTLWYTDASLTIQNVQISSFPYSFTVVKNSIIYWEDQLDISFKSGTNITKIYSTKMGAANSHAAIVPIADNFDITLGM